MKSVSQASHLVASFAPRLTKLVILRHKIILEALVTLFDGCKVENQSSCTVCPGCSASNHRYSVETADARGSFLPGERTLPIEMRSSTCSHQDSLFLFFGEVLVAETTCEAAAQVVHGTLMVLINILVTLLTPSALVLAAEQASLV